MTRRIGQSLFCFAFKAEMPMTNFVVACLHNSERVEGFIVHSSSILPPALCKNAEIDSAGTVTVAQGFARSFYPKSPRNRMKRIFCQMFLSDCCGKENEMITQVDYVEFRYTLCEFARSKSALSVATSIGLTV